MFTQKSKNWVPVLASDQTVVTIWTARMSDGTCKLEQPRNVMFGTEVYKQVEALFHVEASQADCKHTSVATEVALTRHTIMIGRHCILTTQVRTNSQ